MFYALSFLSEKVEADFFISIERNYEQTYNYINEKLSYVYRVINVVSTDDRIYEMIRRDSSQYGVIENNEYIKNYMHYLTTFKDDFIYRIVVYLNEDTYSMPISFNFDNLKNARDKIWYQKLIETNMNYIWCPTEYLNNVDTNKANFDSNVYSLIRQIRNPNNYSETIGYNRVDFYSEGINKIIENGNLFDDGVTYLHNEYGDLINCSSDELYQKLNLQSFEVIDTNHVTDRIVSGKIDGEKVLYITDKLNNTDWYLTSIIKESRLLDSYRSFKYKFYIITLFAASIAFLLSIGLAYSISRRIKQLENKMMQVRDNKLKLMPEPKIKDEIGNLISSYNFMMNRIIELMNETYNNGIKIRNYEIKVLQAQINPHFLYNTLDMIKWLIQEGKKEDAQNVIIYLATFYRISLSNGKDYIMIKDELQHISAYVNIQNIRFNRRIELMIEMEDEIQEFYILKLTLQPIIENAIYHGILNKPQKSGMIIIEGYMDEDKIHLTVYDDGIGMSKETIHEILGNIQCTKQRGGYGIYNVKERLLLNYGVEYGIEIESNKNGTKVHIIIPKEQICR